MPAGRLFNTSTKLFLVAGLTLAALWAAWVIPTFCDERTLLLFSQSRGRVSAGARLGVTIGEPWSRADQALRARFKPGYVLWQQGRVVTEGGTGIRFGDEPILTGEAEVSYHDSSWHNGVVTLRLQDGRVTTIYWDYGWPFFDADL